MGSTHCMIPLRNHDACFAVNESYAEIQRIQRDNTGRFDQALGYREPTSIRAPIQTRGLTSRLQLGMFLVNLQRRCDFEFHN